MTTTDLKRYRVWRLYDDSGEHELLDFGGSSGEPQTLMIGTKAECEREAITLNELHERGR